MQELAVIAIVLICLLVVGLQHLFNHWIRKNINETPLPVFGILGIAISLFILGVTIYNAIIIFGTQFKT